MCNCQTVCLCEFLEELEDSEEEVNESQCPRCLHRPYCVYIELYFSDAALRLSEDAYDGLVLKLRGMCDEFMGN